MFIFSSDIDGTIYRTDDDAKLFRDFWMADKNLGEDPILIYNTGRSIANCLSLLKETPLPQPHYIISNVGTEIYDFWSEKLLDAWYAVLEPDWNIGHVEKLVASHGSEIVRQPDVCQNKFKSSWYWYERDRREISMLEEKLRTAGLPAQVVYSQERDLDVLPSSANKGNALRWLVNQLGLPLINVIVAGDSGNDLSMFQLREVRGILPANADFTLREQARLRQVFTSPYPCARGTIDGLQNYRLNYIS